MSQIIYGIWVNYELRCPYNQKGSLAVGLICCWTVPRNKFSQLEPIIRNLLFKQIYLASRLPTTSVTRKCLGKRTNRKSTGEPRKDHSQNALMLSAF